MSMINDVLRDLEERKAPEREGLGAGDRSLVRKPEKPNRIPLVIACVILLLVGGGAFFLWQSTNSNASQQSEALPGVQFELDETDSVASAEALDHETAAQNVTEQPNSQLAHDDVSKSTPAQNGSGQTPIPLTSSSDSSPGADDAQESTQVVASVVSKTTANPPSEPVRPKTVAEAEPAVPTESARPARVSPAVRADVEQVLPASRSAPQESRELSPQARDLENVETARRLIGSGDTVSAIRLLRTFIEENEQDSYSRVALAKVLLSENRVAELNDLMVQVDERSIPELREVKARWYAASGDYSLAVIALERVLPSVSEYESYHALLASYHQKLGNYERSVARYSSLLEHDPERAEWWLGMAIGFDRLKRYGDAALAYEAAIKLPNLKPALAKFATNRLQQLRPQ